MLLSTAAEQNRALQRRKLQRWEEIEASSFCAFLRQCHWNQETEAFGDWKVFEAPLHEEYSVAAM